MTTTNTTSALYVYAYAHNVGGEIPLPHIAMRGTVVRRPPPFIANGYCGSSSGSRRATSDFHIATNNRKVTETVVVVIVGPPILVDGPPCRRNATITNTITGTCPNMTALVIRTTTCTRTRESNYCSGSSNNRDLGGRAPSAELLPLAPNLLHTKYDVTRTSVARTAIVATIATPTMYSKLYE